MIKTMKVDSTSVAPGADGQIILVAGERSAMRMWRDEHPGMAKPATTRVYETVGYVLRGRAILHIEGQKITLGAGDSWLVPANVSHTYEILETFSAVEAISPPPR
jgi:mannose-6-phosphate isomerase-like protein (cupin superfamily)